MAIFGEFGSISGAEIAERRRIEESISTETDFVKLAKYVCFDQTIVDPDPCGKTYRYINPDLTDLSKKALARMNALLGFEGIRP